jgi:hypothetical protein
LIRLTFPAAEEDWGGLVIPVVVGSNPIVHPNNIGHLRPFRVVGWVMYVGSAPS